MRARPVLEERPEQVDGGPQGHKEGAGELQQRPVQEQEPEVLSLWQWLKKGLC